MVAPRGRAVAAPWARAAAEVRVGDGLAALETLAGCPLEGPDDRALHAVLEARARLALAEPHLAVAALRARVPEPLEGVRAALTLRALVGAHAAAPAVAAAALKVLETPNLASTMVDEARYRWAASTATAGSGPTRSVAALVALAGAPTDPAVRPRALARLAALDPQGPWDATLLIEWGHTAEGRRAMGRLDAATLPLAARVARAESLFAARAYDLQQPDERALIATAGLSAADRQRARLRLGITGLRLRDDVRGAVRHLEVAARGADAATRAEALYRLVLGYGRLGRWRAGIRAARAYLETGPKGRRARRAGYQIGRLLHQSGAYHRAAEAIQEFVTGLRRDRETWLWFVGWARYRGGDCQGAAAVFAELALNPNTLIGAKALFWTARCAQRRGDDSAALAVLDTLAQRAPLTYYGALGGALAHRLDPRRSALPARPSGTPLPVPPVEMAWRVPEAGAADARAVRLLVRAGYPRLARPAADRLAPRLTEAARDQLEIAVERFGDRWRRTAQPRLPWREGLGGQPLSAVTEALPPAYLSLVRAAGRAEGVSPWWLLGHMLQESRFRERARSHAGALGPMQVLPRTGRRIAARIGFPAGDFFDDELYRPGVALRHAAWYLAALRREYRGNVLFAIAAYNGGPRRMGAHAERSAGLDHATVIEELGAHETRNYVRKVAEHALRFAALYGTDAEYRAAVEAVTAPQAAPKPRREVRF